MRAARGLAGEGGKKWGGRELLLSGGQALGKEKELGESGGAQPGRSRRRCVAGRRKVEQRPAEGVAGELRSQSDGLRRSPGLSGPGEALAVPLFPSPSPPRPLSLPFLPRPLSFPPFFLFPAPPRGGPRGAR